MQNKVKELNNVITQNPPDMKKLQLVLQGSVSVQVWNAGNNVRNMGCNISNTRDSVSLGYPNTEKRVEYTACSGVVLAKFDETLSRVFDISSQSKLKLRSKRRGKIVKIYAFKTGHPNLLQCCDFLCLNLVNY